ncbi:HWE histidine kinase domain-containing protein [uncultured Jannaschia sp.]|uniref:sensor histidine kinase n=1 Tax=uncultured Jannaschia sp. TaxID=293347 RepID=UPI002602445B|nr:HWE histidine kinase domain-containing protein [uncultured Jannaschia sp.]
MTQQAASEPDGVDRNSSDPVRFDHDPLHLAQLIVDSAVDYAIVTLTADGTITSWNEGAERIMGWTADEIVGRPAATFFVPEDVAAGQPDYEMRVATDQGQAKDERWHLAKDGRRFWASGRMMPLVARPDTEGPTAEENLVDAPGARQVGYLKILRDRTAQRDALARQIALLDLGDRLRDMEDVRQMVELASETLGRTLGASRAGYGTLDVDGSIIDIRADWNAPGGQSLVGRLRFENFGTYAETLRRGGTVAMSDCRTHPDVPDPEPLEAIGIRALLNVPLMERRRLKAVTFVNDVRPRNWTEDEQNFVRGVADRTAAAIDRARSNAEREIVARELAHRMKNVLTIAQVISVQSLRHAGSLDEGRRVVAERLVALGRAQDMLTDLATEGAGLRDVAQQALAPYRSDESRITIEGPNVALTGPQVLGLTLALHELATNAGKYGALSTPAGRVSIAWSVASDRAFVLTWTETDGPIVAEPQHQGFGSQILGRVTGGYFGGTSRTEYAPGGLRFTIEGQIGT